jgi:alpha-galactosidase
MEWPELGRQPDRVFAFHEDDRPAPVAKGSGGRWTTADVEVTTAAAAGGGGLSIAVRCPRRPIVRVALRWEARFTQAALYLGDHWERGYGDLQWRHLQPERALPWYFAAHDPSAGATFAAGVKTQAHAICFWTVDAKGLSLWLDLRSGGSPSIPGDRELPAATIVTVQSEPGESPLATVRRLCQRMCDKPRLAPQPVCGNNNWYYAYGENFDADQVRRDAALLAELAGDHANRPYCVIDAGWSPGGACPGGPWTAGWPDKFPDMAGLAADIRRAGVRPGIWMRPTALSTVDDPKRLRAGPQPSQEKALDLTLPDNLELIRADVARVRSWGYDLIKHDFSTWDAFARWGFEMGAELTSGGWHWADRSLTNAEVLLRLYRTLREAAGDAVLIGCNTVGHLGAGLFELQRTGDDTSGRKWERTRRMGVNTLAFRLPQHGTFFAADADCVAHTEHTPWDKDRQWLDVVARSGTALFVSVDPTKASPEVRSAMRDAMQLALSGGCRDVEPLDWLTTTCPAHWRFDGQTVRYDWEEDAGAWPLRA